MNGRGKEGRIVVNEWMNGRREGRVGYWMGEWKRKEVTLMSSEMKGSCLEVKDNNISFLFQTCPRIAVINLRAFPLKKI